MTTTPGRTKFTNFLEKHGISLSAAARALGAKSHVTVRNWTTGLSAPEPEFRRAIEIWTNGEVAEDDWLSDKERAAAEKLAEVKPFVPPTPSQEPAA